MNSSDHSEQQCVDERPTPLPGLIVMVVAVASSSHLSGVTRHATNLARCLLLRTDISVVYVVVAPWQLESFQSVFPADEPRLIVQVARLDSNPLARNIWHYYRLPHLAAALKADIVHLSYPVPIRSKAFDCPIVVTLHDLYPYDIPENFGFPRVFFNRAILQQCLRSADAIACVSQCTLKRLDMYAPDLAIHKASAIYNCIDPMFTQSETLSLPGWRGEPFLLCVAQHRRNKNVLLAIRVFEELLLHGDIPIDSLMVVVGIDGPDTKRIHHFIRRSGLLSRVVLKRGVSDAELAWCYEQCKLLLAPSSIEGFGYPIVEAMLHRCRIVCSDIPAFREVGGAYCQYAELQFNPVQAFVEAARASLSSHRLMPVSTECFSSARIADSYVQLYSRLRDVCTARVRRNHQNLYPCWREDARNEDFSST